MAKKVPATKSEIMAAIAEAAGITKKQADWTVVLFDETERFGKRNLLDAVFPRRRR